MKITGTPDKEFEAAIEAAHLEALPKAMNMQMSDAAKQRVEAVLAHLKVNLSSRMATSGGLAITNRVTNRGEIRLNYRLLKDKPEDLKDTYLHELAHIVANMVYFESCGHDSRWKSVASWIGAKPERCHKMDVSHLRPARSKKTVPYVCGCGPRTLTPLKAKRDAQYRAQFGVPAYRCRLCGQACNPA